MEDRIPQGKFIGTFLDSPIISTDRDEILLTLRKGADPVFVPASPAQKKAAYLLKVIGSTDVIALEPENYQWFIDSMQPQTTNHLLDSASRCGQLIVRVVEKSEWSWAKLASSSFEEKVNFPTQVHRWHSRMLQLSSIITAVAVSRAKGARQVVDRVSGNLRYVGDEYYGCVSFDGSTEWTLVTFTQLLMLKDMFYMRFNAYVAACYVYDGRQDMIEMIGFVINWQMKCIGYYGNKGYELLKSIEALSKCNLTRLCDKYLSEGGSYSSMVDKVKEKEAKLSGSLTPLVDELDSFLREITSLDLAVEVFGMQKFSGHPLVDPVLAGRSVREEAAKKIDYSPSDCARLRNNCCRIYTEGYIKKNGKWPPLMFPLQAKTTRLYHLYVMGELNIRKDSYPLDDWTGVRFSAHLTFEGFQNYLDLMDDKSVSLYREDCRATWDSRVRPHSHKRLLVELLSREDFSVMGIVERVRRGDIPASWMIVSLYPKERELKIAARLFSMMVIEMRVFFAACEANLAEYVYPCLQAQTMTLRKQEVKELFTALTKEYSSEDLTRLYLEVDLSRWNLRWHPEVVDPVGEDLNDMFGMEGVFNTIHHFFKRCLILVRVNSAPPDGIMQDPIPESDLCFYNHEVGFEGIAQKLWSFLTFGMIDLAMIDHEGPYYLVGQGDNQVLLMTVSLEGVVDREYHVKELTKELTRRIEDECARVGQEAKPEECLQSTSVVTYSKNVYVRGVEYHTVIKGCSRIFPSSSSDFPSINGSIGAISASCTAAAELMTRPLDAYRLTLFHTSLYLMTMRETDWVESALMGRHWKETLTQDVIAGLLTLPNDLGGCLIAPITSFLYKGGADLLSKSVASLKFYQGASPLVRRMIFALEKGKWFDPKADIVSLLEDPYSLPIRRRRDAEQSVKTESLDCVRSISKNRSFNSILSENTQAFEEELMASLLSCNPFNPVLLSDVVGFSVIGIKSNLQNMFTSTQTVQSLLKSSGGYEFSLCQRILMTGALYFRDVVDRLVGLGLEESRILSVFSFVSDLRKSWKREGKPVAVVGVTSYTPFEFEVERRGDYQAVNGFRTLYRAEGDRSDGERRGEWNHYDGLDTQEKRSEYGYKIVTSTSAAVAVAKLARIATQPGIDGSFVNLVSATALTRSVVDLRAVLPLLSRAIGGSIAHRYTAIFGMRGAYGLNTTTWSTNCFPYTDTVSPFSASVVDYPVMVQEMMVAGISAARLFAQRGQRTGVVDLIVPDREYEPLPDKSLVVTRVLQIHPPSYEGNVLVFDSDIRLRRITGALESNFVTPLSESSTAEELVWEAVRAQIRQGYSRGNTALRIIDSGSRFSGFRLDVLEISRIGVRKVCELFALEIAAIAGDQTLELKLGEVRWTPVPAIVSLATAAARSLSVIVSHPLVRQDPFVKDTVPVALFKYSFSGNSLEKKVAAFISSSAIRLLLAPGSRLYKLPEVMFPDDGADSLVGLIARRVRLIIFQSMLLGELHPKSISSLIRLIILKPLSGKVEEDEKSHRLFVSTSSLLSWAEERRLPVLASHLRQLTSGRFIRSHLRSSKEVVRVSRSFPMRMVGQSYLTLGTCESISWTRTQATIDLSLSVVISEDWEKPFSGLGVAYQTSKEDFRLFHINRMKGRVYGLDSNAAYSYLGVCDLLSSRVVVMIGSGYGSGAVVALASGATHVIGLDRRSDLVEEELLRGNRAPPAIVLLGMEHKFTRVEVDAEYDGDFLDSETPSRLRTYAAEGALVVIDIRVNDSSTAAAIVRNIQSFVQACDVLWRFVGRRVDADIMTGTFLASGVLVSLRCVFEGFNHVECWFVLRFSDRMALRGGRMDGGVSWIRGVSLYPDLKWLGGGKEYLERSILGPYAGLSDDEIDTDAVVLSNAYEASVGSLDHRFSYDQFTSVLHACMYVQGRERGDLHLVVERYAKEGVVTVHLLGRTILLSQNKDLDLIMFSLLPRIL